MIEESVKLSEKVELKELDVNRPWPARNTAGQPHIFQLQLSRAFFKRYSKFMKFCKAIPHYAVCKRHVHVQETNFLFFFWRSVEMYEWRQAASHAVIT